MTLPGGAGLVVFQPGEEISTTSVEESRKNCFDRHFVEARGFKLPNYN